MTAVKTRLYVTTDLAGGLSIGLDPSQAHYVRTVLRLDKGAAIALFNGRDGEWLGRIDGAGKGWCSVTLYEQRRPQAAVPDLWLVFAPIKRARIDFLVEKATELGVASLHPVVTQRTVVERVNLDRLRANAIEAAEQTERLSVPDLAEPLPLFELMARWPAERRLLLCDESGAAPPIADALRQAAAGPWAVLVGPEGGFTESELDALRKLPFVSPVGLGPRVLRADTAALAALAVLQALAGDWRTPLRR
ncbi:MAG TPA: 16S rRNA (uracil(1498)-N(3))-methyltransferase [Stellaceae bacterium]|nr:16S rRNA (uracil(1498)-N(3))-methyltransferase [Stellaceae bacterium]